MRNAKLKSAVAAQGGPEVLKDWTAVSSLNTELSAGIDFGADGYSGITLEVRKLNYSGGGDGSSLPAQSNLTLAMYLAGKVLPATIFTSHSAGRSQGNTSGGSKSINKPNLSVTSFGMYSCQLRADFSQAFNQIGYSAKFSFVDSNSTLVGMADVWQVSSFSDPSGYTSELWLTGKTGETLTYEYRIIRK